MVTLAQPSRMTTSGSSDHAPYVCADADADGGETGIRFPRGDKDKVLTQYFILITPGFPKKTEGRPGFRRPTSKAVNLKNLIKTASSTEKDVCRNYEDGIAVAEKK